MSAPNPGDKFPEDVVFDYIPYTPEIEGFKVCGIPTQYKAGKEWQNKRVVIFALPGAFTPTCSASHLPDYIANRENLKKAGVDQVAVIAMNDPYVMSAWGKASNITDDSILFLSDTDCKFSSRYGWAANGRTGRYAMIIDHGKIIYAKHESKMQEVSVSGPTAILDFLKDYKP